MQCKCVTKCVAQGAPIEQNFTNALDYLAHRSLQHFRARSNPNRTRSTRRTATRVCRTTIPSTTAASWRDGRRTIRSSPRSADPIWAVNPGDDLSTCHPHSDIYLLLFKTLSPNNPTHRRADRHSSFIPRCTCAWRSFDHSQWLGDRSVHPNSFIPPVFVTPYSYYPFILYSCGWLNNTVNTRSAL